MLLTWTQEWTSWWPFTAVHRKLLWAWTKPEDKDITAPHLPCEYSLLGPSQLYSEQLNLIHLLHPAEPQNVTAANGIESLWNQHKCHCCCWSSISLRKLPGKFCKSVYHFRFWLSKSYPGNWTFFFPFFRRELNLTLVFLASPWEAHRLQLMHQLSLNGMSSSVQLPIPS